MLKRIDEPTPLQLEFSALCPRLVLASSSPNRKALLEAGGSEVEVFSPDAREIKEGSPDAVVTHNAAVKLLSYMESPSFESAIPAISADTVVYASGEILGKPRSRREAGMMLEMLSGERQTVYTGCALYIPGGGPEFFMDTADVLFRKLSGEEIEEYLETEEWMGAAGGYRLQKTGWRLVESIEGDWATVVGLPLARLISLFQPRSSV